MEESQIVDILIYVLAAGLTVSIFRYWKNNDTPIAVIKRAMLWIIVGFAAIVAIVIGVCSYISGVPLTETESIPSIIYNAMRLPYFSFFYFMIFVGVIYILRDRRKNKETPQKNKKKNK